MCLNEVLFRNFLVSLEKVVVGTGFEPVKAMPADLQSAPVGRLGIPPSLSAKGANYAIQILACQLVGSNYSIILLH